MARASLRRPACIGSWSTSQAFRRLRSTCCEREATNSALIRRAPMLFSPGRHARLPERCPLSLTAAAIDIGERGPWPDPVLRTAVKMLVGRTRRRLQTRDLSGERDFARGMAEYPIAIDTREANDQHYELPPEFFSPCLVRSASIHVATTPQLAATLAQAEERALAETVDHAALADGQRILELGCGWGSLSLWMARKFPNAQIVSVSNSHSQRVFITQRCRKAKGIRNLTVLRGRHQRVCANGPIRSRRFS